MAISLIPSGRKIQGPGKFTLSNIFASAGDFVPSAVVLIAVGVLYFGSILWASQLEAEIQDLEVQKTEILAFSLDVASGKLDVQGITQSFETLGEQFVIWRNLTPYADSVVLSGFNRSSEGQVNFSATLNVEEEFL